MQTLDKGRERVRFALEQIDRFLGKETQEEGESNRAHERFPASSYMEVDYQFLNKAGKPEQARYKAALMDVGAGGMRFLANPPLPIPLKKDVLIAFVVTKDQRTRVISGEAEIVRLVEGKGGALEVGCRFLKLIRG